MSPYIAGLSVTVAFAMLAATASARPAPAPVIVAGTETYQDSHIDGDIRCSGLPTVLAGSHTNLHLYGSCDRVVVAGEHNDISVHVPPGAVIEITGAHNDVTWIPLRRGTRPSLLNRGTRNTFHYSDR